MSDPADEYLDLLDWRRRVAALWARWRAAAAGNPAAATVAFRAGKDRLLREHPSRRFHPGNERGSAASPTGGTTRPGG